MAPRLALAMEMEAGVEAITFGKNFVELLLSLTHCLPMAMMVVEANVEIKRPST